MATPRLTITWRVRKASTTANRGGTILYHGAWGAMASAPLKHAAKTDTVANTVAATTILAIPSVLKASSVRRGEAIVVHPAMSG
jgi:hypothetical protein